MISAYSLKAILRYDPITGVFTRLVYKSWRAKIGAVAGTRDKDGYWQIQIDRRVYKSHRLAWLYVTGKWPDGQIDHEDLDPGNNAWKNLRLATPTQNAANCGRRPFNTSGFKGVGFEKRRNHWFAQIQIAGRCRYLGSYNSAEEAHAAYAAAAEKHHGEFGRAS